jgi:hypothetical protein
MCPRFHAHGKSLLRDTRFFERPFIWLTIVDHGNA